MSEQQWKTMLTASKSLKPYKGKPLCGYSGHEVDKMNVEYGIFHCSLLQDSRDHHCLDVTGSIVSNSIGQNYTRSERTHQQKISSTDSPLCSRKLWKQSKDTKLIFDSNKEQSQSLRRVIPWLMLCSQH